MPPAGDQLHLSHKGVVQPPINIYVNTEPRRGNNWTRPNEAGRGRGRPMQVQRPRGFPTLCWGCNQPGHIQKDCPHENPCQQYMPQQWNQGMQSQPSWNQNRPQQQNREQQMTGPVNPWRGPNQGY